MTTRTAAETALEPITSDKDMRVPYYCEENVWRLAYKKTQSTEKLRFFVCFISNPNKTCAMFHQLAGPDDDNQPVCWDYHVILLGWDEREKNAVVYDIDSRLPYPSPLPEYLHHSFSRNGMCFAPPFAPHFRIIPASLYLEYFSSDRMHMYDAKTCTWNAPPPQYACISPGPSKPNLDSDGDLIITLQQYLVFDAEANQEQMMKTDSVPKEAFGRLLSLEELKQFKFDALSNILYSAGTCQRQEK